MKSFSIIRTQTALTSNIKIIVDSKYNLFLESIDSHSDLSISRFKKFQFNKNNYLDELIPYFFKDFPVDIAFNVKYDNDSSNMSTNFSHQYDDLYIMGAKNIIDNKNYKEEYEYFAPLYIFKNSIPKNFIIFRIDGPGLLNITKDNFKDEFSGKFKVVKIFDLTKSSVLGEWIDNNFTKNSNFPISSLEVDFRELEFSKWIGIDYNTGGYTYKSFYLDENLENENTLFDFDKLFIDGYKNNKVIFPHIINFSFLFDDTPSTPTSLRKWSLNRYAGFYLDDLEEIDSITPFKMPELHSDVSIYSGNIITSSNYGDPFKNGYRSDVDMWVEYLGKFYKVKKIEETLDSSVISVNGNDKSKKILIDKVGNTIIIKYKIISEIDLTGKESLLNLRECYIDSNNIIRNINNNAYTIDDFSFADVNIIEIDGVYHNLILNNGQIQLNTDYGFSFQENNKFTYYTNSGLDGYTKSIDLLISNNNSPISFKIFRVKFTDIKDFDTNIIDTEFSKFEYEKRNDIVKTEEPKMYLTDLRSKTYPLNFDDFIFNSNTENLPVSSDYTANLETFRIENKELTHLWRKNPVYCRWGYQNSIAFNDYPYLLNNNDIHEKFNKSTDTQSLIPNRQLRNLDYFYSINSGTTSYLHHSLHIEKNNGNIQDSSYKFELDKYLELGSYSFNGLTYSYDFNYFEMFFSQTQSFIDGELVFNKKKYSYFESGDNVIPNITIFKGLKIKAFEIDNIKYNNTFIENVNLVPSNIFENYKFSVLLSSNDWMVSNDGTLYKPYNWDYFVDTQNDSSELSLLTSYSSTPSNINIGDIIEVDQFYPYSTNSYQATASIVEYVGGLYSGGFGIKLDKSYINDNKIHPGIWRSKMQWQVIKKWQLDVTYQIGDYVIWNDVIYKVTNGSQISDPSSNPSNLSSNYSIESLFDQFWNYSATYSTNDWVYRSNEYYSYNSSGVGDFWNPLIGYVVNDIVLYEHKYYKLLSTASVDKNPSSDSNWIEISYPSVPLWKKIELWDKNNYSYSIGTYIIHNDILYSASYSTVSDDIPGISTKWDRLYSFVPDTSFNYQPDSNSIININNNYHYCRFNPNITLDSGITIYINKKWKNIFVNIAINDNTLYADNISMDKSKNLERDLLYCETNGRLTAANFIRQINDLDTLYGFSDYTSYVIIEEDGSIKKYNFENNLDSLPYLLVFEEADSININNNNIKYSINTVDKNILKSSRYLINGQIDSLEKLDFYNELPLGVNINTLSTESSSSNNISYPFFRYSGYYMPIFYDIDIFNNPSLYKVGSLCEAQFVLWLGTGSTTEDIILHLEKDDTTLDIDMEISLPESDSELDISLFYQQVIDVILSQDIFSNMNLEFEIYDPSNTNIHNRIENGFYVLSIKYSSNVCNLRVSAKPSLSCIDPIQYLFYTSGYNTNTILSNLNSGMIITDLSLNFCCPTCGPASLATFASMDNFIKEIYTQSCSLSATASINNYNTYDSLWSTPVDHDTFTISSNITFNSNINDLSSILPRVYIDKEGISEYGSSDIFSSLISNTILLGLNFTQSTAFLSSIFDSGIVVSCNQQGLFIGNITQFISYN